MLAVKPSAAFLCALILWIKHHGLRTAVASPLAADWYYADLGENAQNSTLPASGHVNLPISSCDNGFALYLFNHYVCIC